MCKPYTDEEVAWLKEAWAMRQRGVYSLREIAEHLGMDRITLKEALEDWLDRDCPEAGVPWK